MAIYNKMADSDAVKKGEPHWSEVLTDVLLGFLAQPSQLWRMLSKQAYRHISSHLTNEALQLIVKVSHSHLLIGQPCVCVCACVCVCV